MTYQECIDLLFTSLPVYEQTGQSAYKPGLDNIKALDELLGQPHRQMLTIHVAGTNGKGSVSHMLASTLQSAGYRTGLYTSPHLKDFRERIRIDGEMIPQKAVVDFVERYREPMERIGLSFFEMCVGMAFWHFLDQGVEVAVIETGLGGRLDATNVIEPVLSIITNIGMDHMNLLGDTIGKIALEKAGIIKRETPVVIGESHMESKPVFETVAGMMHAPIVFADTLRSCRQSGTTDRSQILEIEHLQSGEKSCLELDLLGDYQCRNAVTLMAAFDILNKKTPLNISLRAIREGCSMAALQTGLRGRWQIIGRDPLIVCDTCHNEHGIRQVAAQIARQKYNRLYMVIGFVKDKDLPSILPLLPRDAHYFFTAPKSHRALEAQTLQQMAQAGGLQGELAPCAPEALRMAQKKAAPDDMIFIGGSTFLVADL